MPLLHRLIHDKLIYHKNLSDFLPRYPNTHLGNTLLVDETHYRTCLNPLFNAIFVDSYEYMPKEDNYLMTTLLSYLKFLYNSRLNVPTFVEFYTFSTINDIKEDNVRFRTLFEKCTMACSANFCINYFTFVISHPNILFCSSLVMFFWIFQSH